ncbi:MAG: DUF2784 domain-containing protein [Gammaproteobacteria bacterium]|nr:DUF2784 domain-containing protein [Gammaproteobacteria bacterium]
MLYALLADLLVLLHLLFILFVVAGGLLVLRLPSLAWLHLPCLLWGVFTIVSGSICPLTPWEVEFRLAAGQAPYSGTFIAHYIEPIIYPPGLTRAQQIVFGLLVALLNTAVYLRLLLRVRHKPMRNVPHG